MRDVSIEQPLYGEFSSESPVTEEEALEVSVDLR
jgi:hypothetical protein